MKLHLLSDHSLPRRADRRVRLDLVGPLSLHDADGNDLTPRAKKAQGLLALVATSPKLRRSRSWLQDKLWSDRGQRQGADSLRQCLVEIRSALGEHVDCLRTDHTFVALDPDAVNIRTWPEEAEPHGAEFLEGLDVRDPEFEDWLRLQRRTYAEKSARARRPGAIVYCPTCWDVSMSAVSHRVAITTGHLCLAGTEGEVASNMALDHATVELIARGGVEVIDLRGLPEQTAGAEPAWMLSATASIRGKRARLTLKLVEAASARILWVDSRTFDLTECYRCSRTEITALAEAAADAVASLVWLADRPPPSVELSARSAG